MSSAGAVVVAVRPWSRSGASDVVSLLSYLRTRSLREGLVKGRRGWFAVGAVVWTLRGLRRLGQRRPQTISTEVLAPGETLQVSSRRGR